MKFIGGGLLSLILLQGSLLGQTTTSNYDPNKLPKYDMRPGSRVTEYFLKQPSGTTSTFSDFYGTQGVTGSGSTGRIGTTTGLPEIKYTSGDKSLNFLGFTGGIKIDDSPLLVSDEVLKSWFADGKAGTGTLSIVPGSGIQVASTYDSGAGKGTVTITAVGTASAGGITDTGTQAVVNAGYNLKIQNGKLDLTASTGILGLIDSDVPNTITLDNITQVGTRTLADMQGMISLGTQSNKSVVIPDVQIGGVTVGTDTTELNFANDVFVGSVTGGAQTTVSLKPELKGTTSATAGYLVKLDGSGKVGTSTLPSPLAFGAYVAKNPDTEYTAATDGFVIATIYADNNGDTGYIRALVDSSSPPTTERATDYVNHKNTAGNETYVLYGTLCVPVRKNDVWIINVGNITGVCVTTIYWMPLQ